MIHVIGYYEARATAQLNLDYLAGAADETVRVIGDDIYVPDLANLAGVYAFHGTTAAGAPLLAQVSSPSLRALSLPDISRMHGGGELVSDKNIDMNPTQPIALMKNEALNVLMANDALVGAVGLIGVFLSDGVLSPVTGDIRTVHCTTVLTGTAGVWSTGTVNLEQDLLVGRYQVVGARCIEEGKQGLFRLIFVGYQWRPGGVCTTHIKNPDLSVFRRGNIGVWGEFDQLVPPSLEVLMNDAASNPELYLDLIKVA